MGNSEGPRDGAHGALNNHSLIEALNNRSLTNHMSNHMNCMCDWETNVVQETCKLRLCLTPRGLSSGNNTKRGYVFFFSFPFKLQIQLPRVTKTK